MISKLMNDGWVDICMACGSQNTHYFNYGSAKSLFGPFMLHPGMGLRFRIDDDNDGPGHIEDVVFEQDDFPDFNNITTDQMVSKLNSVLDYSEAENDYGGVLITSKEPGITSCVEPIDGAARAMMGFALYPHDGMHLCCSRPAIGWVNFIAPEAEGPQHYVIHLRKCGCGAGSQYHFTMEALIDSHDPNVDYQTAHRYVVNSLARHLHSMGHVDADLKEDYEQRHWFQRGQYHPHIYTGQPLDQDYELITPEQMESYFGSFPMKAVIAQIRTKRCKQLIDEFKSNPTKYALGQLPPKSVMLHPSR